MKYVTFAIMAVLIFGVAAAPIFSNGVAFAQTEKQVAIEKKEKTAAKKEVSTERKETSVDKKQNTVAKKEVTIEKKKVSKEQRHANNEQQKAHLIEKFANMPEEKKQSLQVKLDAMKDRHSMLKTNGTSNPITQMSQEEKLTKMKEIRESINAQREARSQMTLEEKQVLLDKRIAVMKDKRENYVSPRDQVGIGLSPKDIICAEGKELVIKVSNEMPVCLGPNAVFILMDRGTITYPE